MGPRLLEHGQGREGRAGLLAEMPLYGDMGEYDAEKDEVAEVMAVLDEAAGGAAAGAGRRPGQDESPFAEIGGELTIGLERTYSDIPAHADRFGTDADAAEAGF